MFYGLELEGKYKGLLTLFIEGDKDINSIQSLLDTNDFQQVYFGAKNQSKVTKFETLLLIKKKYPTIIVSYEFLLEDLELIPKEILENDNIHKIITIKNLIMGKEITVKIENSEGIFCFQKKDSIYNSWKDYDKDIKVI